MAIPQALLSVVRVSSGSFGGTSGVRLEITNWNEIIKVLGKLDKEYVKELRKDFRRITKPVQKSVQDRIPARNNPPMSGMKQVHFGRLAWGTTYGGGGPRPKPAKSVLIQTPSTRTKRARRYDTFSISRLQVGSPATVLFDMAGRKSYTKGRRGFTPEYDYMYTIGGQKVPGKRKHRVVPFAYAKGLAAAKSKLNWGASRIVWPAAEKALPRARAEMEKTIIQVNARVNALLRSN